MSSSSVLVVLINYKRPQNMPAVIRAWHEQTVSTKIVVVDNSPCAAGEIYWATHLDGAHDVWKANANYGCCCRFAPAAVAIGYEYLIFADDDRLPGKRAIEAAIRTAESLEGKFATIGMEGRLFLLDRPAGQRYSGHSCPRRTDKPVETDITCQTHLFRADLLHHVLSFRQRLIDTFGYEAVNLCRVHDDFQLCLGIQHATSWPSYITPWTDDPEEELIKSRLPEGDVSVWRRPGHFEERNRLVDMALEVGWRPAR